MPNSRSAGKYINNGIINKRVLDSEIDYYLSLGWKTGMIPRTAQQRQAANIKREKTCLEKYGVSNVSKSDIVKQKIEQSTFEHYGVKNAWQSEEVKEKIKNTNIKKYGVPFTTQSPEINLKRKQTKLERYGNEYYNNCEQQKATIIQKYGSVENYCKKKKEKFFETLCKKYGSVENAYKIRNLKTDYDSSVKKQITTKRKNNSFNKSKSEELLFETLCENYGLDNIIRQYSEERYPFACDFYIIPKDLFIELNKHWTHGGMPFDPENSNCIEQLNIWKEKAKTSKFYENAINTWTVRDVEKQKYAREKNLNYECIY